MIAVIAVAEVAHIKEDITIIVVGSGQDSCLQHTAQE